jgi:hypothetical protein
LATQIDPGFDEHVLAETLGRFDDHELPVDHDDLPAMRAFFAAWAAALAA